MTLTITRQFAGVTLPSYTMVNRVHDIITDRLDARAHQCTSPDHQVGACEACGIDCTERLDLHAGFDFREWACADCGDTLDSDDIRDILEGEEGDRQYAAYKEGSY